MTQGLSAQNVGGEKGKKGTRCSALRLNRLLGPTENVPRSPRPSLIQFFFFFINGIKSERMSQNKGKRPIISRKRSVITDTRRMERRTLCTLPLCAQTEMPSKFCVA